MPSIGARRSGLFLPQRKGLVVPKLNVAPVIPDPGGGGGTSGLTATPEPGYQTYYFDDYNTPMAQGGWDASPYAANCAYYDGFHATDGTYSTYSKNIISAHDSLLDYNIYVTGGQAITACVIPGGYGGFGPDSIVEFVARADDSLTNIKWAILSWPTTGQWSDGENDYSEAYFGTNAGATWFLHGINGHEAENIVIADLGVQVHTMHTYRCVSTPTSIKMYTDGVLRGTYTGAWSRTSRRLTLQVESWYSAVPNGTTGHVQFDAVKIQVPA